MKLINCFFRDKRKTEELYKSLILTGYRKNHHRKPHFDKQEYLDENGFRVVAFISPSGKTLRGMPL